MRQRSDFQKLKKQCLGAEIFPAEVLKWIENENLWNLWVPRRYGGLELSFSEGLDVLKNLAGIDGSLGWTITLCSGANYFVGNLIPETAEEIFQASTKPVLGGSGGVFGTAEKHGEFYIISGKWRYATGAPYLTHFTLNAKILKDGKEVKNPDGSQKVLSFVLPKKDVQIIADWKTMGMKATATHSFEVREVRVHENFSFIYNKFYLPQPVFRINFSVFADLTLWVNYLGMAESFYEEALEISDPEKTEVLKKSISQANKNLSYFSAEIEKTVSEENLNKTFINEVHQEAADSVQELSASITQVYPRLGIRAASHHAPLNQIFRDFFTATQHHIFVKHQ